jgi:hypothetical protein
VTLFTGFGIGVRLPGLRVARPLRYRQLLDGTGPELDTAATTKTEAERTVGATAARCRRHSRRSIPTVDDVGSAEAHEIVAHTR